MLKGIALTVKGWFRNKAEQATDLRLAGREHIHSVKASIEDVRNQRNELAGKGILLEDRIAKLEQDVQRGISAVKNWAAQGDEEKKNRSYAIYQKDQQLLDKLKGDLAEIQDQVQELDDQILRLESDTEDAADDLDKAATQQILGKATSKVEDVHREIKSGPLAGAIENSKRQGATAEARRRARASADNSDLYTFNQTTNVLSMDDILGNKVVDSQSGMHVNTQTHESVRGKSAAHTYVDDAGFTSGSHGSHHSHDSSSSFD